MNSKLTILSVLLLAASCASLDSINKNPACVVWKDQKYLGPYSTEVLESKAVWSGSCRGAHWKCRTVDVSFDENKNVLIDGETNIGKIEGINFNYLIKTQTAQENSLITYTALRAYSGLKEVHASVSGADVTKETIYKYNDKCSSDQAIIGGIALGMIAEIQKEK
jgi:hypothetical protein